jgi:hypothetical protein
MQRARGGESRVETIKGENHSGAFFRLVSVIWIQSGSEISLLVGWYHG